MIRIPDGNVEHYMKFAILNRDNIQYIVPNVNLIIISMTEPENIHPPLPEKNKCLDSLKLTFTDEDNVVDATYFGRYKYMFSDEQADEILDFCFKYEKDIELIISQCDGGISRSSGVAAALSVIFNGSKSDEWVFNTRLYIPNMFVYRKILNRYTERI